MAIKYVDRKLGRFIIVGIINTIVGCGVMFGLYNLFGCSYWVSSAANYVVGSILSYFLNKYYTFRHKGDMLGSAFRFVINIAVCYLLAYGIAKPLVLHFMPGSQRLQENVAMFVGMCLFTGFNYLGQRLFAFRNTEEAERRKESQHDQN
ncbi:MAG: GtrA family protein [Firmicutes bacterium]|nr:GtrA family protein [Bacillota bacterium]